MSDKKYKKQITEEKKVNEPATAYKPVQKPGDNIHFFSSFEQQEDFKRRQMAAMTPDELLSNLESMRKFFLRQYLSADGNWMPLSKIITFQKPKTG